MSHSPGQLTHCVFFTLKDSTPQNRQSLLDDCNTYLRRPDGVVSLFAGLRVEDLTRAVNDGDFDVSLVVVFTDRAAHDVYQDHPEHLAFIERNKETWQSVRVFDSVE